MTENTIRAMSFVTSVACEELPIKDWLLMLQTLFPEGMEEDMTLATVINYYASKMPGFEKRAEDCSQLNYDKLYDDLLAFIKADIAKNTKE